ncbi:MAG: hypothetical protein EHM22_03540 [Actinobacteria bacterium]|nr:MAG: hypothetical protein EHM22_03540 [Actinomycetota bacterium]
MDHAVRGRNRVQRERDVRRQLGRDGDVDAPGRRFGLRRRLRFGRRLQPSDRRRRRRFDRHGPVPGVRRRDRAAQPGRRDEHRALRRGRERVRRPVHVRPELPHVQHGGGDPRPDELGRHLRGRLAVLGSGDGVRLADLHRRRGDVPDGSQPGPRDHGPVRADAGAVRRGGGAVEAAERAHQQLLGPLHGRDRRVRRRLDGRRDGMADQPQPRRVGRPGRPGCPVGGDDRLGRHLDDLGERTPPQLHAHVDGLHDASRGAGGGRRLVRGAGSNTLSCDATRELLVEFYGEGADAAVDTVRYGNCGDAEFLDSLFLWKTPLPDCGDDRGDVCIDYSEWTQAWTEIRGA